jgi:hypothetical protein
LAAKAVGNWPIPLEFRRAVILAMLFAVKRSAIQACSYRLTITGIAFHKKVPSCV